MDSRAGKTRHGPSYPSTAALTAALLALVGACGDDGSEAGLNAGAAAAGISAVSGAEASTVAGTTPPPAAGQAAAGAGAAGSLGTAGTSAPPAGTGASQAGRAAGGSGGQGGAGSPADAGPDAMGTAGGPDAGPLPTGPTLPAIGDPGDQGPYDVQRIERIEGLSTHTLFVPAETNSLGVHPAVVWTCGNGGSVSFYASFLEHLASHGFLVVADKASSSDRLAEVASQGAAIDWLVAEHMRDGGDFFGKVDLEHVAVMGHSLGSLASFATAAQAPRVATSLHFSGGLTGNPVGFDESWLADMTKPAAFLCGGSDATAGPSCEMDFEQAPMDLPVFYGVLARASHIGPFLGTPRAGEYGRAAVAWLRWQLASDATFGSYFVGSDCTLCGSPWTAQQRNLE